MPKMGLVVSGNAVLDASGVLGIANRCEESNVVQSLWLGEVKNLDAGAALGAISTTTKRIGLGTSIINIYSRSPAQIAMLARTLQEASGGRFTLGVGVSTPALVEGFHGMEFDKPLPRMREYVGMIRSLLQGEKLGSQPTILKPTNAKLIGNLPSRVKIFVAALNSRMARLAGEIADGVIFNFLTPSSVHRKISPLKEGADAGKRQFRDVEICTQFYIDHEYNEQNLKRLFYFYSSSEAYRNHFASLGFEEAAREMDRAWASSDKDGVLRAISPNFMKELTVAGDRSKLVERIDALEKSGIRTIILAPNPYSDIETITDWAIGALSKEYSYSVV